VGGRRLGIDGAGESAEMEMFGREFLLGCGVRSTHKKNPLDRFHSRLDRR